MNSGDRTGSWLKTGRSSLLFALFFKLQLPLSPAGGCRDKQFQVNVQASPKQRSGLPLKNGVFFTAAALHYACISITVFISWC